MTRSAEVQARRYLRLFPEWMREVRGEEAVSLVLDQLPPDADGLPLRPRLDLVRAGLHARRRGTPPLWVLRTVSRAPSGWFGRGSAIPSVWRPWLIARLRHPRFTWQCAFMPDLQSLPTMLVLAFFWSADWGVEAFWIVVLVGVGSWLVRGVGFLAFRRPLWRSRLTAFNGLDLEGRPLPPTEVTVGWDKPARRNTWVLAFAVAGTLSSAIVAPIAWAVLARAPEAPRATQPWEWSVAIVSLAVVGATTWVWMLSRRMDRSAPPTGDDPPTARDRTLAITIANGVATGATAAVVFVVPGIGAGFHASLALAAPLGWLGATLVLAIAQHSIGRVIGAWDLLPSSRPQAVVRRVQDLPPPPPRPDTPAFG